jgi:superfamily II RNA helicase
VTETPRTEPPVVLDALPPAGTTDTDVILNAFLDVTKKKGLELYPAQEEALLELLDQKHVILSTPTGSGKSHVALGAHFKAMSEGHTSIYTAPIKALVSEKFFALCNDFGAPYVGMMTGDATINRDAPILCCTAEILSNLSLNPTDSARIKTVVMDEFHYYGDKERGMAWQIPLLTMPHTQFLLMSATLGDMTGIASALEARSGRKVTHVTSSERPVPLDFEFREQTVHECLEALMSANKAPVYIVHFTQRDAAEQAQALTSINFTSKEVKDKIGLELRNVRFDSPFGKDVQKLLRHGIGLHHAGLLPKYRLLTEKLAQDGLLKVICGTDTLGVGVNIPIRTVLFTKLAKYDGEKTGILSARDFKQISGRAGRKGFDTQGSVVALAPEHVVENKRAELRFTSGETKKKPQKKQPEQGFVSWDKNTFDRLVEKPPESLTSRFEVTHGLLLQCLQTEGGYRRLVEIVMLSHESDDKKRKHLVRARVLFRSLVDADIIHVEGRSVKVAADLQTDFSLHQALSLFLVETLFQLDPASESYPLDVCSLVESVLEDPKAILLRQQDKERNAKYHELKAQGVEYNELREKLDEVTWPKPLADEIYQAFNAFKLKHPWVGDNVRPKSIARDMLERYASFSEYVKEYGLEKSEGLLLRALSDFYKTLVQSVPESRKDERVLDVQAYFRTLIARVDSSLVEEWESLLAPEVRPDKPLLHPLAPPPLDADPKQFLRRVRAELHAFTKALALDDYEEATHHVRGPSGTENPWTAQRLKDALAPFLAAHGRVVFEPIARMPDKTLLEKTGDGFYRARQILVDEAGDNDWAIECEIDLNDRKSDEPLLTLVQISG